MVMLTPIMRGADEAFSRDLVRMLRRMGFNTREAYLRRLRIMMPAILPMVLAQLELNDIPDEFQEREWKRRRTSLPDVIALPDGPLR